MTAYGARRRALDPTTPRPRLLRAEISTEPPHPAQPTPRLARASSDARASVRPDPRSLALEDEIWLTRTLGLARARHATAAALCVSEGRLLVEACGPAHGLAAPDRVVLQRLLGARPRPLTLYAWLETIDPHRALSYREVPLARIVLRLARLPSEDTIALLSQRGVDVRVSTS